MEGHRDATPHWYRAPERRFFGRNRLSTTKDLTAPPSVGTYPRGRGGIK